MGLPGERTVGVDVKRLATPGELLHALQLPGSALDQHLGARRLEARSTMKIEAPGRPVETIDETFRLDSDGKGGFHAVHDNPRDGLEAVSLAGVVYTKPRYGHWTRRRLEGDDAERLRENVEGVGAAYVELLSRWLAVKELGRSEVNGRQAVRLELGALAAPSSGAAETLAYKKWRDTLKVRSIRGEWTLEAASGAPLGGKLEASYSFERSDLKGPVQVTLEYEQHLSAAQPIAAPPEAAEVRRPRPLLDRDTLLDGLAPARPNR